MSVSAFERTTVAEETFVKRQEECRQVKDRAAEITTLRYEKS